MRKEAVVVAFAVLTLAGCGAYFDQHPANVRPESEAVATVLAQQRPVTSVQPPVEVAETASPPPAAVVPAPPAVTRMPPQMPPQRAKVVPARSVAATPMSQPANAAIPVRNPPPASAAQAPATTAPSAAPKG